MGNATQRRDIPDATGSRLPEYLRALTALVDQGVGSVSSEELAALVGVSSAKLRKDLSYLGSYGVRGVGYDVDHLSYQISLALGLTHDWAIAIIGMGNLGRALSAYNGFASRGVEVMALFDHDPSVTGTTVGGITIEPIEDLPRIARERGIAIALLATPARSAQTVADAVVDAGITSILNFAPTSIDVPEGVQVRNVDLATEVQILAFHHQQRSRRAGDPTAALLAEVLP